MKIILICCLIFFISGLYLFIKARQIKTQKKQDLYIYNQQLQKLNNDILTLEKQKRVLIEELDNKKKKIKEDFLKEQADMQIFFDSFQENLNNGNRQYISLLEKQYKQAEKEYDIKIQQLFEDKKNIEQDLKKVKDILTAGTKAIMREKAKKEEINFYKISLSEKDIQDIEKLTQLKASFNNPTAISKLIWSTYIQKQVTDLCNRIIGKNTTCCGIYKITNLNTQECYIGQSLNIAERLKTHCKYGCGINTPLSNKLYKSMLETGIWNFSFEVLEKDLQKTQLNERERFWIEMYQSNIFGLNGTQGNK